MWRLFLALLAVLIFAQPVYAAPCTEAGSLVSARTSAQGRNELAVFVFRQPATVRYTIEGVSPPFTEDPSDNPIAVAGELFMQVTFHNVNWMCEIAENFKLPGKTIVDVKRSSQFEGMVSFIIGRNAGAKFHSIYSYDTKSSRVVVVKFRR